MDMAQDDKLIHEFDVDALEAALLQDHQEAIHHLLAAIVHHLLVAVEHPL